MSVDGTLPNPEIKAKKISRKNGRIYLSSPKDGSTLVSAAPLGILRKFPKCDIHSEPFPISAHQQDTICLHVSHRGSFIASGSRDGTAKLFSTETGEELKTLLRATLPIRDVSVSPDEAWVAVVSDDGSAKLVKTNSSLTAINIPTPNASVTFLHVAFSPRGDFLSTSGSDGVIRVFKFDSSAAEEGETDGDNLEQALDEEIGGAKKQPALLLVKEIEGAPKVIKIGVPESEQDTSAKGVWNGKGTALAFPTAGREVKVLAVDKDFALQATLSDGAVASHSSPITDLQFSPNGDFIATSSARDRQVIIWNVSTASAERSVQCAVPEDQENDSGDTGEPVSLCWAGRESGLKLFVGSTTGSVLEISHVAPAKAKGSTRSMLEMEDELSELEDLSDELDEEDEDEDEDEEDDEEEEGGKTGKSEKSRKLFYDEAEEDEEDEEEEEEEGEEEEKTGKDAESDADDRPANAKSVEPQRDLFGEEIQPGDEEDDLEEEAALLTPPQDPYDAGEDIEDWIVDDDGAGYAAPKRRRLEDLAERPAAYPRAEPEVHAGLRSSEVRSSIVQPAFQPGSTKWKNNRKYLSMNAIGYIWTVDLEPNSTQFEDKRHSITVSFFDKSLHREYHFDDHIGYDLAALSTDACVFATSFQENQRRRAKYKGKKSEFYSTFLYRPHDNVMDSWELSFPAYHKTSLGNSGDSYDARDTGAAEDGINAIAVSASVVVVSTTNGYIRVYDVHGTPLGIYREASAPIVAMNTWNNYVWTVRAAGSRYTYSIEHYGRRLGGGKFLQRDQALDVNAAAGGKIKNIFFSSSGDPVVYDSRGTLLVLLHWREGAPNNARWVPLLDLQKMLSRNRQDAEGEQAEGYWPIGVDQGRIACILTPGMNEEPGIPLSMPIEIEPAVPITPGFSRVKIVSDGTVQEADEPPAGMDEDEYRLNAYHQEFLHQIVSKQLLEDAAESQKTGDISEEFEDMEMEQLETAMEEQRIALDKTLLRLIFLACQESKTSKTVALAGLLNTEKALDAALQIVMRFEMNNAVAKINKLRQERVTTEV